MATAARAAVLVALAATSTACATAYTVTFGAPEREVTRPQVEHCLTSLGFEDVSTDFTQALAKDPGLIAVWYDDSSVEARIRKDWRHLLVRLVPRRYRSDTGLVSRQFADCMALHVPGSAPDIFGPRDFR